MYFEPWITNSDFTHSFPKQKTQHVNFRCYHSMGSVHGIVQAWWFICDMDCLSLSSSQWMFICLIRCCFPQEPLKLSVPGNNYMFPRGGPNIQGIKHHLACKSFSLFLTLCLGFYFPFLHLSLSFLLLNGTNIQSHWFPFDFTSSGSIHSLSNLLTSQIILLIFCFCFFGNHFCAYR